MDEKNPKDLVSSAASDHDASSSGSVDAAWKFLNDHREAGGDTSSVDINALRRKIDWHIVPLMFGCYTMQFLDKVILNVRLTPPFFFFFFFNLDRPGACFCDPGVYLLRVKQ